MKLIVGVSGASWANNRLKKLSYTLGKRLAQADYTLLTGGLGGVMEHVCKGAQSISGHPPIIGLLPGSNKASGNPYLDIALPTGLGYVRNTLISIACDVLVGVSGGAGTLSEIAFAWQYQTPIIILANSGGWCEKLKNQALDHRRGRLIYYVNTVEEVIAKIDEIRSNRCGRKNPKPAMLEINRRMKVCN